MAYKGIHEFTAQALVIEDAETELLAYAKRAVLGYHTKARFKEEVDKIITKHLEKLSQDLRDKARNGLRIYAQKCFKKQKDILLLHVAFFALLLSGASSGNKEARRYLKRFEGNVSREYRGSTGFKAALDAEPIRAHYPSALPLGKYHEDYMKQVEQITKELIQSGAKEDYATNVSLRNVAEMTVRYEHQLDMIDRKRKEGKKLVYILAHANCSERCEKYQVGGSLHPSGLYSLDGTSGTTPEGVPFKPLEFATDNPIDRYITRAGKSYQNGCLTGFNCRHQLGDYIPGVKPQAIPQKVIEKRRAVEQRQREFERDIRACKKALIVEEDAKARKYYRKKGAELKKQYQAFSVRNNVAWYPDRLKVFDQELFK